MNKTVAITAIVMFAVILGMSAMSPAMAANNVKSVPVCHYDQGSHQYSTIYVSQKSADFHVANHAPDDYYGVCGEE
jgi:hypothetical protein